MKTRTAITSLATVLMVAALSSHSAAAMVNVNAWKACNPGEVAKWTLSDLNNAEYGASASGGTGVIFAHRTRNGVPDLQEGMVAKLSWYPDPGPAIARAILTEIGLPHDRKIVYWSTTSGQTGASKIKELLDALDTARKNRAGADKDDTSLRPIFKKSADLARVGQILGAYSNKPPASVLATEFLNVSPGTETFGEMLNINTVQYTGQTSIPQTKDGYMVELRDLALAVKALKDPKNQQMLGALFITDFFLGNGDRLSKGGSPNWNNIVLGVNGCLMAIDSTVVAPSVKQVMLGRAHKEAELEFRPNQVVKKFEAKLAAGEYEKVLLEDYFDFGFYEEVVGPYFAFDDGRKSSYPATGGPMPVCWNKPQAGSPLPVAKAAINHVVGSLVEIFYRSTNTVLDTGHFVLKSRKSSSDSECILALGYRDRGSDPSSGYFAEEDLDLAEFVLNFQLGAAHAMEAIGKMKERVLTKAVKEFQDNEVAGIDRYDVKALRIRAKFINERLKSGSSSEQIMAGILKKAKTKKITFKSIEKSDVYTTESSGKAVWDWR